MINRVLVPVDDSEMAQEALEFAIEVYPDADITAFHVVGGPSLMMGEATGLALADDIEEAAEDLAHDVLETATDIAAKHDTEISTAVDVGDPARAIVNRAEEFDLVVIGTHGGKLTDRLLTGDVAHKVFRGSPVPVTVVR